MKRWLYIVSFLLIAMPSVSFAQKSIEVLNSEIRQAEEEIRRNTLLLEDTKKDKEVSQRELKLITNRIVSRRRVADALQGQIDILNADLKENHGTVDKLGREREKLREEYASMIRESYKNYLLSNYLAFLFASDDFDDLTRRIDYMRRYNALRESKAARIDSLSGAIEIRMAEIDAKRSELEETKTAHDKELRSLGKDETQYKKSLADLKAKEGKISRQIADKQAQIRKAQQEIARMVAAENKKAGKQVLSAEQQRVVKELTGRFDQNKGKLPWPVRGGAIIDRYGVHAHPTQKSLTSDNKGVNIAGSRGAAIYSVFEGTVVNIFFYQGLKNIVMVRHGNYLTVYANLGSVRVKTGDKVALNQTLGTLANTSDSDDHVLHFEVWKESAHLNPEHWLLP